MSSLTPQTQTSNWKDYVPEPNTRRIKELIARRKEQFSPDDDDLEDTDPKVDVALGFLGAAAAALQIFMLLPWYMTDWTNKKSVAVYKSQYFLPAALTLGFIGVPGSGFLGFYVGVTLIFVRFLPWFTATQLGLLQGYYAQMIANINPYHRDKADVAGSVPDDEYLVPYDGVFDIGGDVGQLPTLRKDRSLLALGESRSGKTSALKMLAAQWRVDRNTAIVAHGSMGEYQDFFESLGIPIQAVIGPKSDTRWNLFNEVSDGLTERKQRERFLSLAESLVPVQGKDPYWDQSAQQMFADIMMVIEKENENPHHGHIIRTLDDPEQIVDKLENHGYGTSSRQIVDNDGDIKEEWQNYNTKIRRRFRELFGERGSFSFREYFDNPQGAVVIETPDDDVESVKNSYGAMCRYTCTWAKKKSATTYLLLDEIDSVGKIPNLGVTASEANKNDIQMLVGIQSIGQLGAVYDDDLAGITTNLQQVCGFAPGTDSENTDVEFLQAEIGERDEAVRTESKSRNPNSGGGLTGLATTVVGSRSTSMSEERRSPITSSEMKSWTTGEGIVSNMTGWYHLQWSDPEQVIDELHARRGAVEIGPDNSADPEPADDNWSESSRSSEQTEWVEVGNTDDGGRSR